MTRLLRETALTAGAVVGLLCLLFALVATTAGVRALAFTSGSMAPTIRTGDLAVTRPVPLAQLAPGDVVSVFDARGVRITHRVVTVDDTHHRLWLKGDANATADPLPYGVDHADRVLVTVPGGGRLLAWSSGPTAMLVLGGYLVFLLGVLRPRRRVPPVAGALVVVLALATAHAAAHAAAPQPTLAAWTDAVPVTGTTARAYTVPKPVITGCSVSLLAVTVTWTAVTSPYALTYTAVVAETGQSLTVTSSGTTRSARYTTVIQSVGGATQTIRITAALPSASSWTSTPATQTVRLPLLGVAPSCGAAT